MAKNNNIYIIGTDCYAKALQQVLSIYYSNCKRLQNLPTKETNIKNDSLIICTPYILSQPKDLFFIFRKLFKKKIINWSAIIGIFNSRNDIESIENIDVFGGGNNQLMINNMSGLKGLYLPFNLGCLVQTINKFEEYRLTKGGYKTLKGLSALFKIKDTLNKYILKGNTVTGDKLIKIKKEILQINWDMIFNDHEDAYKFRIKMENLETCTIKQIKMIINLLP